MNKPFDCTKVPYFVCNFKFPWVGEAVLKHLISLGYSNGMWNTNTNSMECWVRNFGNVERRYSPVGRIVYSPANSSLYHGYSNAVRIPNVRCFELEKDLEAFLKFLEDSQKVKEVKVILDGNVVSAEVTKNMVTFSSCVKILNAKDLEIIQNARKQLD